MTNKIEVQPDQVMDVTSRHVQMDRMNMVMDLDKSHGSYIHDSLHGRDLLDFFSCFATIPLGYNHPKMTGDEGFNKNLVRAALINPSNSDVFTTEFAQFLKTFSRVAIPSYLQHAFFVAGGSLAVENAMKTAMDWKVQKNFMKGYRREIGTKILHFDQGFHGRSGYTLSVTNTEPNKTKYFAKFEDWPRVSNPMIKFPYTDHNYEDLLRRERISLEQIKRAFVEHKDEICAILIEPIQSEGGDHHFRKEFMEQLRALSDENECMLVYDEVQTGVGITGEFWAHQHFGVNALPDIIAFGKKMQVCGILAGPKVDEIEQNAFVVPSRINSTWGGNLVDMIKAERILQIIEEDKVVEHVRETGAYFLNRLHELGDRYAHVTNVRGRGLLCAFDLPTRADRDSVIEHSLKHDLLLLGAGPNSIRFRPTLTITKEETDKGVEVLDAVLKKMHA